ncbi:MAG TPA: hypothetical protein VHN98_02115 [Acidimicrobiales bacterium]|nr:hypothetical protein [Acidimicrobiales bacterium]
METEVRSQLEQWRQETADKPLQSAQQVQDRLLDLYAALRAYPIVSEVEKWLSLTRERSIFDGKEITELLDEIELEMAVDAAADEAESEPAGT